jgi:spore coat protein U-like protein
MDNTFSKILERIFLSKKLFFAAVPIIANAIAAFTGYDPTAKGLLVLDALFAALLVIQGLLDLKFGSASDATTPVAVELKKPKTDTVVNVTQEK